MQKKSSFNSQRHTPEKKSEPSWSFKKTEWSSPNKRDEKSSSSRKNEWSSPNRKNEQSSPPHSNKKISLDFEEKKQKLIIDQAFLKAERQKRKHEKDERKNDQMVKSVILHAKPPPLMNKGSQDIKLRIKHYMQRKENVNNYQTPYVF